MAAGQPQRLRSTDVGRLFVAHQVFVGLDEPRMVEVKLDPARGRGPRDFLFDLVAEGGVHFAGNHIGILRHRGMPRRPAAQPCLTGFAHVLEVEFLAVDRVVL